MYRVKFGSAILTICLRSVVALDGGRKQRAGDYSVHASGQKFSCPFGIG